ncbi:thiaminase II/PqqC family protein [Actinoallomurus rhizosphaericola]|uniref:iron-containing redox enzyme family protein n=1 Tax=Actinoallomurus rhizosphaericola TaxID=2952536 RepID=UPI0020937F3F|nr:iron-containing redox enzyme family protein [Actinoallomurus rhizosphaericola]MCO5996203.1 iron-containing redox enzyme family protein [Actinoallomurus rhizosphaericola]
MSGHRLFERPALRPQVRIEAGDAGATLRYLGDRRWLELDFLHGGDAEQRFLKLLQEGGRSAADLAEVFPGTADELDELLAALDEQGMLTESATAPAEGLSGVAAYGRLKRNADAVRARLHSPFVQALAAGEVTRDQLIGYAVEYWHITHLCPRALAPVLARDDISQTAWSKTMAFYQMERNHDRLLEKSLQAVGVSREVLRRVQPLPATMALMAALGVYAYEFPAALFATLFPMEEPEPEFLELFVRRCEELGLPEEFTAPIVAHSGVNEDEDHEAVTLELLAELPFVGLEEVRECAAAVTDILEQRARLDGEIIAWYGRASLRDLTVGSYPSAAGKALTCVSSASSA